MRFLSSVEPEGETQLAIDEALEQGQLPKIREREGVALPAHKASGSKAIAGLSVSVPDTRFTAEVRRTFVDALWRTKASLESDLKDFVVRR